MTSALRRLATLSLAVVVGLIPTATATAVTVTPKTGALALVLPAPTGPRAIGELQLHLVDKSRNDPWVPTKKRELMASVWYPAANGGPRVPYVSAKLGPVLAADWLPLIGLEGPELDYAHTWTHARATAPAYGRFPVVLYSPGLGTSRTFGTEQVEELVSHGYVVVTVDHTGEAPTEFPGGRIATAAMPSADDTEVYRTAIRTRTEDLGFVLDQLERLPLGFLDLKHVGVLGFSAGGFAGAQLMLTDRRVDAGVNLDGAMVYDLEGEVLGEAALQGLDRPFLQFGHENHSHREEPGSLDYDPSWVSFWKHQRGWKLELNLVGSHHPSFADYQWAIPQLAAEYDVPDEVVTAGIGTIEPARSIAAQRAYLLAYFDQFLKGRPQALLREESSRFPEVQFVR